MRPSEIRIPVGYPNDDPANGPGMVQGDFDEGQIGWDDLRTIDQLLAMPTFNLLEPEFQRCYIAMCVAAWIEAGLLCGVGTGWRSEAVQAANHAKWPNQFSSVENSLHMRKPPRQVAYAIDSVPYDVLGWAHKNCGRFFINYLEQIIRERHHCQPSALPDSGAAYNKDAARLSTLAAVRHDLPYLGTLTLAEWLALDAPITIDPSDPTPPGDDMYTDEDRTRDKAIYDALFVEDPGGGPEPLAAKINQIHTIMRVLWDGFPGVIVDAPGSIARTIKAIAAKVGAKVG